MPMEPRVGRVVESRATTRLTPGCEAQIVRVDRGGGVILEDPDGERRPSDREEQVWEWETEVAPRDQGHGQHQREGGRLSDVADLQPDPSGEERGDPGREH